MSMRSLGNALDDPIKRFVVRRSVATSSFASTFVSIWKRASTLFVEEILQADRHIHNKLQTQTFVEL